jgi:hypothetical protein
MNGCPYAPRPRGPAIRKYRRDACSVGAASSMRADMIFGKDAHDEMVSRPLANRGCGLYQIER